MHQLHCTSGHCSNRTHADRLRRDGAPQMGVCQRASCLQCDACEPRKLATITKSSAVRVRNQTLEPCRHGLHGLDSVSSPDGFEGVGYGGGCVTDDCHGRVVCAYWRRASECNDSRTGDVVRKSFLSHFPRSVATRFDSVGCFVTRGTSFQIQLLAKLIRQL